MLTFPRSVTPEEEFAARPVSKAAPRRDPLAANVVPDIPRYLVPLLPARREAVLRLLTVLWFALGLSFWAWWFSPARGAWSPERVIATAGLAWVFLLAAYSLFFCCRMAKPNPVLPIPELRVAMVVTKAPSEPWEVVERTLRAMLDQDFPYDYDVWIADERPSGRSLKWCKGHGVQVSTRKGIAEYHQPSWPRRTKCKEGNLAYFYDTVGYRRYDVVAQLDADHVPARDYLQHIVRPFADPRIGYVAAPSICDANAEKGWTVRGRLYREASLHGPVQAGSNGGYAPLCIGSHYAVRTKALEDVGGLGPDLAEDFSTTLWMQSGGWDGVFAIDAIAHGDGPETVGDMLTQELQWSKSLGTILTRWTRGRISKVPLKAQLRMRFALLFYFLQGMVCLVATSLPTIGVLTGHTWGNASLAGFYLRLLPCSLLLVAIQTLLRRSRVLRPVDAKIFSVDVFLFQMVRWPWATFGFLIGMLEGLRKPTTEFKVTPKGKRTASPLGLSMVAPPLVLSAVPAVALVLAPAPAATLGLYIIAIMQFLSYLAVAATVVGLHVRANLAARSGSTAKTSPRRRARREPLLTWATGGQAASAVAGVAVLVGSLVAWRVTTLDVPFM